MSYYAKIIEAKRVNLMQLECQWQMLAVDAAGAETVVDKGFLTITMPGDDMFDPKDETKPATPEQRQSLVIDQAAAFFKMRLCRMKAAESDAPELLKRLPGMTFTGG